MSHTARRGRRDVGAGNDLGDGGQAEIGLFLPEKAFRHDRHRVVRTPEFSDKDGPGLQPLAALIARPLLPVAFQKLQCRLVEATKGLLLDSPGQRP